MIKTQEQLGEFRNLAFAKVSSNEPYGVGKNEADAETREMARDAFIASDTLEWPENNFPLLDLEELKSAERQLQAILWAIAEDTETPDVQKDVAFEQVAIKLAELYRHMEVIRGLGTVAVDRRELSRERAGTMTMEIFGTPDPVVFNNYLQKERTKAARLMDDETIASFAADYLEKMGQGSETTIDNLESFELHDETDVIKDDLAVLFPGLGEFIDSEVPDTISVDDAEPYFTKMLDILGLREKGWTVGFSNGRAMNTVGLNKQIQIGNRRGAFNALTIKGVALHEALHALRYQNMIEQDDSIKQSPLPGNLEFEEGLLTSIEQIITGERRVAGLPYFLSLGFQLNMDGGTEKRRNFRETYDIMWRRALIGSHKQGEPVTDDAILTAKRAAFQTVIRTTRGNSLDARDISYFEGGRKATKWLNHVAMLPQPERLRLLRLALAAKYDITNPTQAALFDDTLQTE